MNQGRMGGRVGGKTECPVRIDEEVLQSLTRIVGCYI